MIVTRVSKHDSNVDVFYYKRYPEMFRIDVVNKTVLAVMMHVRKSVGYMPYHSDVVRGDIQQAIFNHEEISEEQFWKEYNEVMLNVLNIEISHKENEARND